MSNPPSILLFYLTSSLNCSSSLPLLSFHFHASMKCIQFHNFFLFFTVFFLSRNNSLVQSSFSVVVLLLFLLLIYSKLFLICVSKIGIFFSNKQLALYKEQCSIVFCCCPDEDQRTIVEALVHNKYFVVL